MDNDGYDGDYDVKRMKVIIMIMVIGNDSNNTN